MQKVTLLSSICTFKKIWLGAYALGSHTQFLYLIFLTISFPVSASALLQPSGGPSLSMWLSAHTTSPSVESKMILPSRLLSSVIFPYWGI